MKTSVASVTFRKKGAREVAQLARAAGLDAIEWGGDVHVPPGDMAAARLALRATEDAGLGVSAYGSYYAGRPGEAFGPVLKTALALGCRVIRVWAGRTASHACPPEERKRLAACLAEAVELAAEASCVLATEYHADTLADGASSTLALLEEVPGLRTFWQPPVGLPVAENLEALQRLAGRIENLHVYHWDADKEPRPLQEGRAAWRAYLAAARRYGVKGYATLEFVRDGSEAQFLCDAATLHELLEEG